ncbi:hypothetical protein [Azospirillum endophyticum]
MSEEKLRAAWRWLAHQCTGRVARASRDGAARKGDAVGGH